MFKNRLLDGVLVLAATAFAACGGGTNRIGHSDAGVSAEDAGVDSGAETTTTAAPKKKKATTSAPKDAGTKQADDDTKKDSDKDEEDASTGNTQEPKPERPQDARKFTIDEAALAFEALPDADAWHGKLGNAGYRVEVPKNWNGILVMYAHGYGGTGNALGVTTPSIRQHLIDNGYAWAASSYSTNYYDVRAGIEDTNELALEFTKIAEQNGRKLEEPRKRYVIGHSMGGHVAGAAIEREAHETALHKVDYAAALPMCGVMGDTELFNYFTAFQWAAEKLAGIPYTTDPVSDPAALRQQLQAALFKTYPNELTWAGIQLRNIVRNLTGGARSNFEQGYAAKQWQDALWSTVGGDGTINGILAKPVTDTREIVYQFDDNLEVSDEERAFNDEIHRSTPAKGANDRRKDGLRWIPAVNGEFDIPVVTLHTLGDLYVPFKMEQIYNQRAEAKGSGRMLVQRAIRGTGHCEFTIAEQVAAFDAMALWEQTGLRPQGDNVVDAYEVSRPTYGCRFTNNTFTDQEKERGLEEARKAVASCFL